MRALLHILLLLVFIIFSGCTASPELNSDPKADSKSIIDMRETSVVNGIGNLSTYRPEVGTVHTYSNAGEEIYVHKIIASNKDYVQMTISLSGAPTTQVYKWTDDEIVLVYENSAPSNPSEDILEGFEPSGEIETIMNFAGESDWELIDKETNVNIPYGSFDDVLVVRKVTDEVEGADTIYTRYYAPGMGLVKETFQVTGESGYEDGAELERVN